MSRSSAPARSGLFAVFECGMLKMRCHVIDALDSTGGQCAALYPEKPIYDIPGYPRIEAADLIRKLEEQIAPFKPVFHLGQQVNSLTQGRRRLAAWRPRRARASPAKAVIIAAGVGAFGPNRPPLPGIEAYEGQERLLLCEAARGFPRQAHRHRRRRRFGAGLDAGAGRHRLAHLCHPPPAEIPRRAGERGAHGSAGQGRQGRDRRALSAARAGGRRRQARRRHRQHARRRRSAGSKPTCCCRSSAWR